MHAALFAEVDPNQAEGPLAWVASVAEALACQGYRCTVLLRARRTRPEPLALLDGLKGVTLVDPYACGWATEGRRADLTVAQAADILERLDEEADEPFDAFILRGASVAAVAANRRRFRGRLALYVTDVPQDPAALGWLMRRRLRRSFTAASLMLCQTPELETYLRAELRLPDDLASAALPPMVPAQAYGRAACPPAPGEELRLVYAGKFAPAWNTLEMTRLPAALEARGVSCRLHVAGGKALSRPDPDFPRRMEEALQAPGVVAHGTLPRLDALTLAAGCHLGLSWRAPELDGSLEISTKLLEYGALGLPVLCNPTAMHRRLLGDDYPFFAATWEEVVATAARAASDPTAWESAARAGRRLAERHRMDVIGRDLADALRRLPGH